MPTAICDYEGSHYRDEFWGQGREYEDAAERLAVHALLPPAGRRLVEIGAGYGRLAELYKGYQEVYLLDYARSQLQQAQEFLAGRPGIVYVLGDIYNLPFSDGLFDTAVTIRVLHHISDIPAAFAEIARILPHGGTYVLEYANKRNVKGIIRYLLGRQPSPFTREPWEFVKLNYDFHPAYMEEQLKATGFALGKQRAVSLFRLPVLKRLVGARLLAAADGLLQAPLGRLKPGPSVLLAATMQKPATPAPASLWRCPRCHSPLPPSESAAGRQGRASPLICDACGARWGTAERIYDFKEPLALGGKV